MSVKPFVATLDSLLGQPRRIRYPHGKGAQVLDALDEARLMVNNQISFFEGDYECVQKEWPNKSIEQEAIDKFSGGLAMTREREVKDD